MFRALILLLVLLAGPLALADENWPEFRGPRSDGHSDSMDLPVTWSESQNVKWRTPIHGRGWSSPVVWNDQIWVTTATPDGRQMFALCLDRASGRVVHDVKLFDVERPSEIHTLNSYASPTPTIEEGRVYVHFGSYGTACLDTATAEKIWERRDLVCEHFRGPGSSPTLIGDMLVAHYDGFDFQYIIALDKRTGRTVWKTDRNVEWGTTDGDIMKAFCTPLLVEASGRRQLISPCSKATLAYDPDTGRELWRVRYEQFSATARPVFAGGLVFINTGFGKADLWAVRPDGNGDVTDTHVVWKATKNIGSKPSPLAVDDLLYIVHDGGVLTCLEAATGQEVWSHRLGGEYSASPIFADGKIFIPSQEGKTTVIKPGRQYQELAVNQLDDGFMASPAVAGKSLILRTRSHLYRIEK